VRVCDKCGTQNADPQTDNDLWCINPDCHNFLGFPTVSQSRERSIVVRLVDDQASVVPGAEASLTARVRNSGDIVEKVIFTVEGDTSGWTVVEPGEVGLFPNQSAEVRVNFRPPRSPNVRVGLAPFRLVGTCESDATIADRADGTVDVGPFVEVKASLVPLQSSGPSGAEHTVVVENGGNTEVEVRIEPAQPGNELSLTVTPASVRLGPGARDQARIAVAPRDALYAASEKRYPFSVSVVTQQQPPIGMQAVHVQEAQTTEPTLVLADSRLHAAPGEETTTSVTVRNRGRGGEDYALELLGPAAAWGRVVPPTIVLPSAGETAAKIGFLPPLEPPALASDVPFGVRCFSRNDNQRSIVAEGLLTVDPTSNIDYAVTPERVRGRWSSRHLIEVDNRGNAEAHLQPIVRDPEHDLSFAVSPPELRLPANSRTIVTCKARLRRPKLYAKPTRRSFQVFVAPASKGDRVAVRGEGEGRSVSFDQLAVLPRKTSVLVVVLAVIGALVGAALAILGHQIHQLLH
jgi:P pilus assembly chaperone PapD